MKLRTKVAILLLALLITFVEINLIAYYMFISVPKVEVSARLGGELKNTSSHGISNRMDLAGGKERGVPFSATHSKLYI